MLEGLNGQAASQPGSPNVFAVALAHPLAEISFYSFIWQTHRQIRLFHFPVPPCLRV